MEGKESSSSAPAKATATAKSPPTPTCANTSTCGSTTNGPTGKNADTNPALLLNTCGGRLSTRGAHDIITAIADDANLNQEFSSHVLRHTFGTTMIRQKHDIVVVAELMGHQRLETTRSYTLPTAEDRERAINSIPSDR